MILSSPSQSLILPGNGLQVQSQGLESRPAGGDEQALIIQEAKAPKISENLYSQVNGIFVPGNIGANNAIELVKAGDTNIRYGQQESASFSFAEVLHNSLEKIITSEVDNTSIEDIKAYFGRLEDTTEIIKHTDSGFTRFGPISRSPLVMNRETFKEKTYYPLKEFSLNSDSLNQLENIVLKSLKIEDDYKSSPAKRFALRFLTNTVFIENFKSEEITEAVIQGLKTDREPAAKKIYEHYLTTQLGNLAPNQKEEIIDALNQNSRLSSHLAQSLFLSEPSSKDRLVNKEFPAVNNFEDLEKILKDLQSHSKVAMNQVDLLPPQINPDVNYGIEIELKLPGMLVHTDGNPGIRELLKPYADFIELGIDARFWDRVNDVISETEGYFSELRTLSGGFKLNEKNQRNLFEIVNIFHKSPELMLFLSQHVHVDKVPLPSPDLLLKLQRNQDNETRETKSLNLDTMQLNPNNNLVYGFDVSNLVDQMIVLEELKNIKPSAEAIIKSFELNDKYGISLGMAQVMLTAVESGKDYLIPNLLRLNSEGKNYLETNYLAENEVDLINHLILEYNTDDTLKAFFDKLPEDKLPEAKLGEALTRFVDDTGRNALMFAVNINNKETAEFIMSRLPKASLQQELTRVVDKAGRNALMIAVSTKDKEIVELIMSKLPEAKLEEELIRVVDKAGQNALMIAVSTKDKEIVELIMNNIPEAKLEELLTKFDNDGWSVLTVAVNTNDKEIVELIMNNIPEAKLEELLTKFDNDGWSPLMVAVSTNDKEIVELIMNNIPKASLQQELTRVDDQGHTLLINAIIADNIELVKLIANKIPADQLAEQLSRADNGYETLMMLVNAENQELVDFIIRHRVAPVL